MDKTDPSQDLLSNHQTQLQRIFVYYCSFADKQNHTLLKSQNYQRMVNDLHLSLNNNLIRQIDLIIYSHASNSGLSLDIFVKTLKDIAKIVFFNVNEQQALQTMITQHIEPLYDVILKDTDFGHSLSLISAEIFRQNSFIFLKRFQSGLLSLYKVYFTGQGKVGKEEEFKMFSKLSRDLTLIPRVVNKPISYLIFAFLRQRESKSAFEPYFSTEQAQPFRSYGFSFICFLQYLIILSHINFKGEEKEGMKIYRLLQFIQVSPGCQKLSKKMKFQHFLLSQKQLQEALTAKAPQIKYSSVKTVINLTRNNDPPLKKKLGRYYDPLKTHFIDFCTKKQVQTNFYLPHQKAKQILTTICPKLTTSIVDNLVTSVQRINFDNFVTILELTADKVNLKLDRLIDLILQYRQGEYKLELILKTIKLSRKQQLYCRQTLRLTQGYLRSVYDYYEANKSLSLGSYIKCLQQMGAIPQILSPRQAYQIYKVCTRKEDQMTFSQLQQSLLAITIAIHFECDLQGVERLVYLLEKICDSKRGEILMKKNLLMVKQHPLYMLRLTYSAVYKQIENKIDNNNKMSNSQQVKLIKF